MSPGSRASRRRNEGYTLIEIMIAIAVFAAGAVAILALQTASTHGNLEARQMSTASDIASSWIERLHRDTLLWNVGGPGVAFTAASLARTSYLQRVSDPGSAPEWIVPPLAAGDRASYDHFGQPTGIAAEMRFCVNVRLQWVYVGQAMRADVRVWYPRSAETARTSDLVGCAPAADPDALTGRMRDLRMVYASTVLRWVPLPNGGP